MLAAEPQAAAYMWQWHLVDTSVEAPALVRHGPSLPQWQ
jgi:hypothetical protein